MAITPISDNAFVMSVICNKSKENFGVTVDKIANNHYKMVWAFKLDRDRAKREGYDKKTAKGSLDNDVNYPGCPYCGCRQLVFCSCGAVTCWDGESRTITCPKCKQTGEIANVSSVDLKGGAM